MAQKSCLLIDNQISNTDFKNNLLYLQDIEDSIVNQGRALDLFTKNLTKVLTDNGFTLGESQRSGVNDTYYKTVIENITKKKMFGENEEKQEHVHYKVEVTSKPDESIKIEKFRKSEKEEYWFSNGNASFSTMQSEIESINSFIKK